MFKVFLFALLIFLNCGSDKSSLVKVESDPYEPILGYWLSGYKLEWDPYYYEMILDFQPGGKARRRTKRFRTYDTKEVIYPWTATYVWYSYIPGTRFATDFECSWGKITAYSDGDSLKLEDIVTSGKSFEWIFTKQDALPDWAE